MAIESTPTRITPFTLENEKQPWQIAQAKREIKEAAILRSIGVTPAEASLFNVLHFGLTVPPDDLICRASTEDYSVGGRSSQAEMQLAFSGCLAKGWLQHVDEALLLQLQAIIREEGIIGPVYGYPYAGGVDFTIAGAKLWLKYCSRCNELNPHMAGYFPSYLDTVHQKYTRFYSTLAAAEREISELSEFEFLVRASGPAPIGPWRAQWWRRFDSGFQVEFEEQQEHQGRAGGGGGEIFLQHRFDRFEFQHAQQVLERNQLRLGEWLCMCNAEHKSWPIGFANQTSWMARGRMKLKIPMAEYQAAFDSCLQKDWLRILDEESIREVGSLLANDPVFHPVTKQLENALGFVDFSPAGAALYRQVSAEILGPDWEETLLVSQESYREDHHYSVSQGGFRRAFQEIAQSNEHILEMSIEPLSRWCVYWWEQFPAGYRLELKIGTS